MKTTFKRATSVFLALSLLFISYSLSSCSSEADATGIGVIDDFISTLKGELVGNDYYISEFDHYGHKVMTVRGDKVTISTQRDSSGEKTSYLDITIDGYQWQHVGDTLIFAQNGLEMLPVNLPDVGGVAGADVGSWGKSTGLMIVDGFLNDIWDLVGKDRVVVVYSQLGQPIGVFQGESCKVTIPSDLPTMTRVNIDGKSLYVYRANIDIYDKNLIH